MQVKYLLKTLYLILSTPSTKNIRTKATLSDTLTFNNKDTRTTSLTSSGSSLI